MVPSENCPFRCKKSSYEEMIKMQKEANEIAKKYKNIIYKKKQEEKIKTEIIRYSQVDFDNQQQIFDSVKVGLLKKTDDRLRVEDTPFSFNTFLLFIGKLTENGPEVQFIFILLYLLIDEIEFTLT